MLAILCLLMVNMFKLSDFKLNSAAGTTPEKSNREENQFLPVVSITRNNYQGIFKAIYAIFKMILLCWKPDTNFVSVIYIL